MGQGVHIHSLHLTSFHWGLKSTSSPILAMSPEEETLGTVRSNSQHFAFIESCRTELIILFYFKGKQTNLKKKKMVSRFLQTDRETSVFRLHSTTSTQQLPEWVFWKSPEDSWIKTSWVQHQSGLCFEKTNTFIRFVGVSRPA